MEGILEALEMALLQYQIKVEEEKIIERGDYYE